MTTAEIAPERQHRKERLAASFRLFGRFGFDEGVAGHITARDPERLDHFWVNPFAMNFKQIRVSDLLLVNDDGDVVEGDRPGQPRRVRDPLAGARGPSRRDRRRARALGPRQGVLVARPPARSDHAGRRASSTTTTRSSTTSPVSCSTPRRASASRSRSASTRPSSCATTDCSPSATPSTRRSYWFITMERSCQAQLLASAAGDPISIDPEMAALTASQVGSHGAGAVRLLAPLGLDHRRRTRPPRLTQPAERARTCVNGGCHRTRVDACSGWALVSHPAAQLRACMEAHGWPGGRPRPTATSHSRSRTASA